MNKIALVTDRQNQRGTADDRRLIKPFRQAGIRVEFTVWNDPKVKWQQYDDLIFRSCWDYPQDYAAFLTWLVEMEKLKIHGWNPLPLIKWNTHKSYLLELKAKGARTLPTIWLREGEPWPEMNQSSINKWVVKPLVGNSSHEVKLITANLKEEPTANERLLQPWLPEISHGEYSLIFFNRQFSHAVLRPVTQGDFMVDNRKAELTEIPDIIRQQAQEILKLVDYHLLYARVDGVMNKQKLILMELELTEPYLFLSLSPGAEDRLVSAYLDLCQQKA